MNIYSKDRSIDGHPITKNGKAMDKREVINELNSLADCIAHLKNVLWSERNRTVKASDAMDAAIETATNFIGKT